MQTRAVLRLAQVSLGSARARVLQRPPPRSPPSDLLDKLTHVVRNEVSKPIVSIENY